MHTSTWRRRRRKKVRRRFIIMCTTTQAVTHLKHRASRNAQQSIHQLTPGLMNVLYSSSAFNNGIKRIADPMVTVFLHEFFNWHFVCVLLSFIPSSSSSSLFRTHACVHRWDFHIFFYRYSVLLIPLRIYCVLCERRLLLSIAERKKMMKKTMRVGYYYATTLYKRTWIHLQNYRQFFCLLIIAHTPKEKKTYCVTSSLDGKHNIMNSSILLLFFLKQILTTTKKRIINSLKWCARECWWCEHSSFPGGCALCMCESIRVWSVKCLKRWWNGCKI